MHPSTSSANMSTKAFESASILPKKNKSLYQKSSTPARAYNAYNLFFILEHRVLLLSRGVVANDEHYSTSKHSQFKQDVRSYTNNRCSDLAIPPLPSRYSSLILQDDWFVPGRNKHLKRMHVKTHGVISFQEVAKIVGANWKNIDQETMDFVKKVAGILKRRYAELLEHMRKEIHSPSSDCPPDPNERNTFCQPCTSMVQQSHQPPLSPPHWSSRQNTPLEEVDLSDEDIISMWFFEDEELL